MKKTFLLFLVALIGLQVIRLAIFNKYAIDEFTYAHASWLISQGKEPFRDFFFHHFPLSIQIGSIVFKILGNSPQNIFFLRIWMLLVLALACISAAMLNRKNGFIAACLTPSILLALRPFTEFAVQFRPDMLAITFFVGSLVILQLERIPSKTRAFFAGFILAAAIWSSEKVLIYGAGYAIAFILDLALRRRLDRRPLLADPFRFLLGVLAGTAIIAAHLIASGNLKTWWEWGVKWAVVHERYYPARSWLTYIGPVVIWAGWALALGFGGLSRSLRQLCTSGEKAFEHSDVLLTISLLLSGASYIVQQAAYPYSLIPFFVFLSIFAARESAFLWDRHRIWQYILLALIFTTGFVVSGPKSSNNNQHKALKQLGELIEQGRPVYDNSGSFVARPSIYFMYFTDQTVRTLMSDTLARDIPAAIRKSSCTAVIQDLRFQRLPESLKTFIKENFQPYSSEIWLWGRRFWPARGASIDTFEAIRDAEYFVEPASAIEGLRIDGKPAGKVFSLSKGLHKIEHASKKPFFILWMPDNRKTYVPIDSPGESAFSNLF